eukprot:CAMPEP_0185018216 /NCGR_PEP_ID=MMETSP1103-20130426/1012_1 /TAXON_ID=36769 /ORGANISM="Paraphysomonas bandaiensis, Strain Caron Lab Isolate" /LENGTH=202 /DNA_ID=CAMNT_0027547947 /DNA_START=142 /DNA_END=750 /DNA_ORIENTATION=-
MTDSCGMLSHIYKGERRDLIASVLFMFPVLREILLFLGCVDADSKTAKYNLSKGRSLLIYIGGEKEQLMTTPGEQKIYVKNRKGFIKLALQYGAHLVPMYAFGENECYHVSKAFMGLRLWLQENLRLGIPLVWGRLAAPLVPLKVPITVEIGEPIAVEKKAVEDISSADIDALHSKFIEGMVKLFDKTKAKHGCKDAKLHIF